MFHHLTLLFSNTEIGRELDPDMVPKSWDQDYEKKQEYVRRNDSWA